jgi:phage FluMu protein Com
MAVCHDIRHMKDSMHIILKCPRCGYRWWLDAGAADRRVRCRKCSLLLKVPHLGELPDATSVIEDAQSEVYVDDAGKLYG